MQVAASSQQGHQDVDIIVTVICGSLGTVLDTVILGPGGRNNTNIPKNAEFEQTKDVHKRREQRDLSTAHANKVMSKYLSWDIERCVSSQFCIRIDPMLASCVTTELRRSRNFESSFRHLLEKLKMKSAHQRVCSTRKKMGTDGEHSTTGQCCQPCIHMQMRVSRTRAYFRMEPDIRWSNRMLPQMMQRVHMEDAFSWLSTLGGAYSSLGDNIYNCAIEAGRVAMQQLYLAERLGDVMLRSRCLLYIALSLMQQGQLSAARKLIRQQYKFATSKPECLDTRLVSMCQGIWHHLRLHYAKRKDK